MKEIKVDLSVEGRYFIRLTCLNPRSNLESPGERLKHTLYELNQHLWRWVMISFFFFYFLDEFNV